MAGVEHVIADLKGRAKMISTTEEIAQVPFMPMQEDEAEPTCLTVSPRSHLVRPRRSSSNTACLKMSCKEYTFCRHSFPPQIASLWFALTPYSEVLSLCREKEDAAIFTTLWQRAAVWNEKVV
jgi:hypothetical protein